MSDVTAKNPVEVLTGITKSTRIAYVFWTFLGLFGGHRFYLGEPVKGLAQLILTISILGIPVSAIWWLIDAFLIPRMVRRFNQQDLAERTRPGVQATTIGLT